jgi:DNA-directed RNA polymerase-3 subunit RPC5
VSLFIVGKLHLHPINEAHQLRPSLTYLDVLSRKSKRSRAGESDSDSDDGPPADPDEPPPPKKDKKPTGEAKEVHVTARKADDSAGLGQGGISAVRREMLHIIRQEDEEKWENLDFFEIAVRIFSFHFQCISHPILN